MASHAGLSIFSSEERKQEPIGFLSFKQMASVEVAKREFMARPNSLLIAFRLPWNAQDSKTQYSALANSWKDGFLDAGDQIDNLLFVYVSADTSQHMDKWQQFISSHIQAYTAFANRDA